MNGQLVLGQVAVLNADALKDGTKKNLLNILVHLDEKKFLKPEFNYNKENAAEVAEQVKNRNLELAKKLKEVQEYVAEQVRAEGSDFVDHLKKALPNMKPLSDYYQSELNKLKDEVNANETVQEIQAVL